MTKYTEYVIRASTFLPNGKYLDQLGKTREILEEEMWISVQGLNREVVAMVPMRPSFDSCPLCNSILHDESYALITDSHTVFPCWECDRLVEEKSEFNQIKYT